MSAAPFGIVVVGTPGAPLPAFPPGTEVVVVVEGAREASAAPGVQLDVATGTPFGASVERGLATLQSALVLVVPAAALAHLRTDIGPWEAAARAFDAEPDLVALTPHVHDGSHVVEAGVRVGPDGALRALTLPAVAGSQRDAEPARDTETTRTAVVLLRRSAVASVGGFDPEAGPVQAVTDLLARLRSQDGLARAHPGLVVGAGALLDDDLGTTRLRARGWKPTPTATELLVVHDRVPVPGDLADERVRVLLESLVTLWPTAAITLLALEGLPRDGAGLRDLGVVVAAGPHDWQRWLASRLGAFDVVMLTGSTLEHRFGPALDASQPQAVRVLVPASLPYREAMSMEHAIDEPEEVAGVRTLTAALRERLVATLERVDAVWCATTIDAGAVRGLRDGLDVRVLPRGSAATAPVPPSERRGVVVDATGGHDPRQAADEAARLAVVDLLPALRASDPDLVLTLLAENPSPLLDRLARQEGVRLVRQGFAAEMARARLVLAPHPYGLGGRNGLARAVDAGTPVLATAAAARGTDLHGHEALLTVADLPALASLARRLLSDDSAWQQRLDAVLDLAVADGRAPLRDALVDALARCGVAPPPGSRERLVSPPQERTVTGPAPMLPIPVEHGQIRVRVEAPPALDAVVVRPGRIGDWDRARAYYASGGVRELSAMVAQRLRRVAPVAVGRPDGLNTFDQQYATLLSQADPQGPATVGARAAELENPPTFTVVIPTYDSDLTVLGETVDSVLAQTYPHWHLVLSDDASPTADVRAGLLRLAAADDRISVVQNEVNTGISGATNAGTAVATGEFLAFCDHDDLLKPHALALMALAIADGRGAGAEPDVLYSDEDKADEHGRLTTPFFKPDWSPNQLLSRNYLNHLTVVRRTLVEQVGGLRSGYDGSQDHDLLLRITELTDRIVHVPEVLYTWRKVAGSTADVVDAKPYAFVAARKALDDALARRGIAGHTEDGLHPSTYRVRYDIVGRPKVAIVIPTRDRVGLLRQCIESVQETSTWGNVEFVVVDNESTDPETLEYLATFHQRVGGKVVRYPHRFNYARMMTLGGLVADADQLLFLNNDTTVIAPDWIEALLEHAQRPEVGAVGGRLHYPHGAIQHEGVIVNYAGGAAGNINHSGWWSMGDVVRDVTAVTGAVTMMRPSVFAEIGGFEDRLRVAFNDVDLCLRVRQAGYQVVYTPYCTLFHHESASRGVRPHLDDDAFFEQRWGPSEYRDPFYNPNLDRSKPFEIYTRGSTAPQGRRTDATGEQGLGLVAGAVTATVH